MRSRSLEHREMLVDMAAIWELLANDLIKTAKGLERIAKLERTAQRAANPSHSASPSAG
jgi:hypothetical protein